MPSAIWVAPLANVLSPPSLVSWLLLLVPGSSAPSTDYPVTRAQFGAMLGLVTNLEATQSPFAPAFRRFFTAMGKEMYIILNYSCDYCISIIYVLEYLMRSPNLCIKMGLGHDSSKQTKPD